MFGRVLTRIFKKFEFFLFFIIFYIFFIVSCSVLKLGPARRVDQGPGRPGPETGPSRGKNLLGNWPGKTRSTQQVDLGPGPPSQTRVRPGQFFFILPIIKRRRFGLLKGQNAED